MNPTIIGLFAVLIWGIALPFARICEERFGVPGTVGTVFLGSAILGLIYHAVRREFPPKAAFGNRFLYGRWLCFAGHEALIMSAILIVRKENFPFVILLNYLWPTAIIVFSVLIAGVKIVRWWAFLGGSFIVVASLSVEILGSSGISANLFADSMDRLAYLLAFIGAISWGMYSALSRRAGDATGGGTVVPFFQLTLGLGLPLSLMPGHGTWDNMTGWWPTILAGFALFQFVAYLCWDFGMRKGDVIVISLGADFIPWLSSLGAHFLLGATIETQTIIAAICLVLGAMTTRLGTTLANDFLRWMRPLGLSMQRVAARFSLSR